jgi:hypothetical protein
MSLACRAPWGSERWWRRACLVWLLAGASASTWLAVFLRARLQRSLGLSEALQWLSPLAWVVLATLLAGAALANHARLWEALRGLGRRDAARLAVLLLVVLLARLALVPGHERVYYDEHTYVQIARAIAAEGRSRVTAWGTIADGRLQSLASSYPLWPAAWPATLAGGLRLTGNVAQTGHAINQTLSLATSLIVGLIAAAWLGSRKAGLTAAALHACLPANALWSRTTASEPLAAFLASTTFLAATLHASRPTWRTLGLVAATAATAAIARNESLLIVPLAAIAASWPAERQGRGWGGLDGRTMAAVLGASLVLLLPHALHLGFVSRHYGSAPAGAGLSLGFVGGHALSLLRYLTAEPILAVVATLAVLETLRWSSAVKLGPIVLWLAVTVGTPLCYFAGSYLYPGGERFALAWAAPCAILAAGTVHRFGAHARPRVSAFVLALLGAAAVGGSLGRLVPHARQQDRQTRVPRADVAFVRSMLPGLPADAVVVTADPALVLAEGQSAVFVVTAGSDPERARSLPARYEGGVFFFTSPTSRPLDWPGGTAAMEVLHATYRFETLLCEPSSDGDREWSRLVPRARSSGPETHEAASDEQG